MRESTRARRAPTLATCFALLLLADVALHAFGLRRAMRIASRLAHGRARANDAAARASMIAETRRKLALAASLYPRRALCLEQSLCLHILLARRGVPNELKIGIQHLPFYAHAWVEHEGRPLNEREEFVQTLVPFPSFEG